MIDENFKEELKKILKIKVIEENNNAYFENYKKRLKNKTLELLSLKIKRWNKDEAILESVIEKIMESVIEKIMESVIENKVN